MSRELASLVWNFGKELTNHAKNGFKVVTPAAYASRISKCLACEHFNQKSKTCGECGCHMPTKAKWETSNCPLKPRKWDQINNGVERTGANNTSTSDQV